MECKNYEYIGKEQRLISSNGKIIFVNKGDVVELNEKDIEKMNMENFKLIKEKVYEVKKRNNR